MSASTARRPRPKRPASRLAGFKVGNSAAEKLRSLLSPDYRRRAEIIKNRCEEGSGDPFGLDFEFAENILLITGFAYRYWFRVEMKGLERIPAGGAILVANHSGQFPIDGVMIGTGLVLDMPEPRLVRSMFDRWAAGLPWVSVFFQRVGQVVGHPENVDLLLSRGELILVFPEGMRGIQKPYTKAYQLDDFGLGFMRLALKHRCPVVPLAIVGAEEQYPALWDFKTLAKVLGVPHAPIPLQVMLPMMGLVPLPSKYHIEVGDPMTFEGDPDDEDQVVSEKVWMVRHTIQRMLQRMLEERKHVFW